MHQSPKKFEQSNVSTFQYCVKHCYWQLVLKTKTTFTSSVSHPVGFCRDLNDSVYNLYGPITASTQLSSNSICAIGKV